MSGLFGDDDKDDDLTRAQQPRTKSSLFGDEGNASASRQAPGASMFGDDGPTTAADDASPWGFTPRKSTGRGQGASLVKTLLASADVPELYIDRFDALQTAGAVPAPEARRLLAACGLGPAAESIIWDLVTTRGELDRLGRSEFGVLLALVGLAQEGDELSLDAVDERRRTLPVPSLPAVATAAPPVTPPAQTTANPHATPHSNGAISKPTFGAGFGDTDPWASPAVPKSQGAVNGMSATVPHRTTSSFTTSAATESSDMMGSGSYGNTTGGSGDGAWGGSSSYGASNNGGFVGSSGTEGGFAGEGSAGGGSGNGNNPVVPRRSAQPRTTSKGVEEVVTVNLLEEKEGMFMFQHRNYEVASVRRNSKVVRRYSDFVWLLDCLHKRYPFRQLPLLPPKRVQINGNHIAADSSFLEKRRRGLARFANALVRHPVLREEQLVVMFLTVPTELAVWRKQATISVQEEFTGKTLPPGLEDGLPQNLQETFDTVRSGVRRSADLYISLCNIVERLCKRKEAIAGEYGRLGTSLTALTECAADTYAIDAEDVPLLNEGVRATARHVGTSRALLDDESRAWDEGVLEDAKTMRDALVSMRDLFDRRDRLARDTIPQLERRIQANEQKLQNIKAKGDAAKPNEAEKVETAIVNDKQSIVAQHARGVFIKECVRDELLIFQSTVGRASRLHQDWAQERVKYAELQADNFRGLVDAVESMPLGE